MESDFDDIPSELMQNAAQASRLRRRGAIRSGGRIDLFPSGSHHLGRENPDSLLLNSLRAANDRRGVRRVVCGGAEEDVSDPESGEDSAPSSPVDASPYRPSPLPSAIDLRPVRARPTSRAAPLRKSGRYHSGNGCGAVLHYQVFSVPRMRSCAALVEDDEEAVIGGLPELTYPVPRSKSVCKCTRERVGCLRCGNEVGVRYRPCAIHTFRIDRANTMFDPTHTHLDEPFAETEAMHIDVDGNDSDSDSVISVGGPTGTGLHSVINTLSTLLGQQRRQPLRSPPPVPTPLRAGLSPMLALSELPPWVQEPSPLPATGANATPLSPVSLTALRRPLRDDGDEPGTPLENDMGESDTGRTPMPARRVRRKRSESIER